MCVCYLCLYVLGQELDGDPDTGVHEALDEPGVNVQVSDETNQPDDQEGCSQHHLLPELLQREEGRETDGKSGEMVEKGWIYRRRENVIEVMEKKAWKEKGRWKKNEREER